MAPSSFFEASDDRLRQALDAMPHKVWMVKPDGPALYVEVPLSHIMNASNPR